jgi:5'-3' exonuclease
MFNSENSFSFESASPKLSTGRVCLIDADYVKYIITSRLHKEYEKSQISGIAEIYVKEEPVIAYTKEWVNDWFMKIEDPIVFCFSGKSYNTFRMHIAMEKEYKGNRKKDYTEYPTKMEDMNTIMKYIQDNYSTLLFSELEADDVVSMLQDKENTYIASKDKDLKQVPGYHYDWESNSIYEISNEDALYNLSLQLLMGDSTDNIPGIKGMGEVGALKFLSEVVDQNGKLAPKSFIGKILKKYQTTYGIFKGTDAFTEMWMLLKMRENRGTEFLKKYQRMFDLKESMLLEIQKRKLLNQ